MAFTTTNPVGAVGDPTETGDITVLKDNNDWLMDTMQVQHIVPGAGSRAGGHFGLSKYVASGTAAAGAAETAVLTETNIAFGTGLWEAVVLCNTTEIAEWQFSLESFTEYFDIGSNPNDLTGALGYTSGAPADDYVKFDFNSGTNTVTISVKPPAGTDTVYRIVVWRPAA